MREFRFRAWDKKTNEFILPANLVYRLDGHLFDRELDEELHNVELLQFTGLKDKNGKEIYEGDIVKYYGDHGAEGVDSSFTVNIPVVYDDRLGAYEPFADLSFQMVDSESFDVIGNIYENPELLEDQN